MSDNLENISGVKTGHIASGSTGNAEGTPLPFHDGGQPAMFDISGVYLNHTQDLQEGHILLNKYQIKSVLGRGGMGVVYLCYAPRPVWPCRG